MLCPFFETLTISSHCSFIVSLLLRFPDFIVERNLPISDSKDPSNSRYVLPRSVSLYPNGLYPAGNGLSAAPPRSDDVFVSNNGLHGTIASSLNVPLFSFFRFITFLLFFDSSDGKKPIPPDNLLPSDTVNNDRRIIYHTLLIANMYEIEVQRWY